MPRPVAETQPDGLDAYWSGVWQHVLKVLKEQGTWAWEQRPLVDEYVFALAYARVARDEQEMKVWDTLAKRASGLADQLALTPRGRKAAGLKKGVADGEQNDDPFAGLDDEFTRKREEKAS